MISRVDSDVKNRYLEQVEVIAAIRGQSFQTEANFKPLDCL